MTGIPDDGAPNLLNTSHTITADNDVQRGGAEGATVSEGSRFGEWVSLVKFHLRGQKEARAPGVTRTPDLRIRNPLLYPAELRAQIAYVVSIICEEPQNGKQATASMLTFSAGNPLIST